MLVDENFKQRLRRLFSVMIPILITQTAIMAMNFFDSSMSGHAGAVDLAGTSIGLAMFMEASIFGVVALFIAKFGTVIIAAHQAALGFTSLLYMVPLSFSMALTILVGVEAGAKRFEEAQKFSRMGIALNMAIAIFLAVLVYTNRPYIAMLYTTDPVIIEKVVGFLFYAIFFQLFDATAAPIQAKIANSSQ